jgi:hypothetical protein
VIKAAWYFLRHSEQGVTMGIAGYLDPGSGSMIASVVAAGFAGIVVVFKTGGRRVLGLFSPKRRRQAAESRATQPEA